MLTCCTALTIPRRVVNSTVRSRISSKGCLTRSSIRSCPPLRVDDITQPIAEQVEAKHRDHQCEAGKQRDPPFTRNHEGGAFRHHDPPLRGRRPYSEPDER